jgi:hypothetical protein
MRKNIVLILLMLLMGCGHKDQENKIQPPPHLIPRDEMISILVDIHLVEASFKTNPARKEDPYSYSSVYYDSVFKKYSITREDFEENLEYYQHDMGDFDKMYEEVITRLSKLQSEVIQQSGEH